jgi:ferric-dicitrate binding protein FerR (iron transport regulator)
VRSRRLFGRARGRFRTRGRHSTATVRGTTWIVKDTCTTTTTSVREGRVVVRDLVKRRNVTVRAGRRYVARAKKPRRRR